MPRKAIKGGPYAPISGAAFAWPFRNAERAFCCIISEPDPSKAPLINRPTATRPIRRLRYGRVVEYTDLVADYAERTLRNLEYIEFRAADNEAVYPVTQLWNSLLGLIVLPRERDVGCIPETRMAELWAAGWPLITVAGREHQTLRQLVRDLRNAITHFNVDFRAGSDREIEAVTVWVSELDADGRARLGERRWEGRMSIEDLRRLAGLIADVYLKQFRTTAA